MSEREHAADNACVLNQPCGRLSGWSVSDDGVAGDAAGASPRNAFATRESLASPAAAPDVITRPFSRRYARSANFNVCRAFCSTSSTVSPSRRRPAIRSKTRSLVFGASPSDGSSSSRSRGRPSSARAIASPSTRRSSRAVGAGDPVPRQRPQRRSLRSPELHRHPKPDYR